MSFTEAISSVFRNYANFHGRARRKEFVMFYIFKNLVYAALILFALIIGVSGASGYRSSRQFGSLIALMIDEATIVVVIWNIFSLVMLIPGMAVTSRRLHDIGKSGAYLIPSLIPLIGQVLILIWAFHDGHPWTNQYGPDPKGRHWSPVGAPYTAAGSGASYSAAGSGTSYAAAGSGASYSAASRDTAKKAKKNCVYCGAAVDVDAVFCTACGRDLRPAARPDMRSGAAAAGRAAGKKIICANCGKSVDQGSSVCPFCGKSPSFRAEERRSAESASRVKSRGFSVPTDLD